jgi:hypothetical protein
MTIYDELEGVQELILFGRLKETKDNIDGCSQWRIETRTPYLPRNINQGL